MKELNRITVKTPNGDRNVFIEDGKVWLAGKKGALRVVGCSVPDKQIAFKTLDNKRTVSVPVGGQFDAEYVNTFLNCVTKDRTLVEFSDAELTGYGPDFGQLFNIGDKTLAYRYNK